MVKYSTGRLLNTREAAKFLRVSEASIRRCSDSGLLAARRVGRRRALDSGLFSVGRFEGGTASEAIGEWERRLADTLAKGPAVIRIVGEMVSERSMFGSEEEMLRYEEAFEVMCRRYPVVVICQ